MIYARIDTRGVVLFRAIVIIEDTFNVMLLILFLYFGTLFAFYGFVLVSVSGLNPLPPFFHSIQKIVLKYRKVKFNSL